MREREDVAYIDGEHGIRDDVVDAKSGDGK